MITYNLPWGLEYGKYKYYSYTVKIETLGIVVLINYDTVPFWNVKIWDMNFEFVMDFWIARIKKKNLICDSITDQMGKKWSTSPVASVLSCYHMVIAPSFRLIFQ